MNMDRVALQEIFGRLLGSTEMWLGVAYLVCLFGVLAFRPEQIENGGLFRISYSLFAAFLILPSVIGTFLSLSLKEADFERQAGLLILQVSGVFGRVLLGTSIVCGLASMRRYKAMDERWDAPPTSATPDERNR